MHVNALRRGIRLLQVVLFLSTSGMALPASACKIPWQPEKYFSLGDSNLKEDASDVSPEGVIVLSTITREVPGKIADGTGEAPDHRVTVIDLETGEEVPGTLQSRPGASPFSQDSLSIQYWKAASPLSTHRRYALSESLSQTGDRPENAEGPTERRISFSTGTQAIAPLEVLGALDVSLRSFKGEQSTCAPGSCACSGGTVMKQFVGAEAQVPGIQGGSTLGTYRVEFYVTANTPYDFAHPSAPSAVLDHWTVGSTGTPSAQSFTLSAGSADAKTPCFAWRALDDAGHTLDGEAVCLDNPEAHGFGCSMGGSGPGSAALGLLALLSATLGGRALTRRGWR